jgi:hypothetical protein
MQLYGKYRVSRPFGWPFINDKHVNANTHCELNLLRSLNDTKHKYSFKTLSQNKQLGGLWGAAGGCMWPTHALPRPPLILKIFWDNFDDDFGQILRQFWGRF